VNIIEERDFRRGELLEKYIVKDESSGLNLFSFSFLFLFLFLFILHFSISKT